jgi:GLPGLI family protein
MDPMKKLFTLLAVTLFTSLTSFAQLTQGHIAYDIKLSSDDPDMAMALMLLDGSTMHLYFGDQKARTELKMSIMTMTTVVDNKTEEILILIDGVMNDKNAIRTNFNEMAANEQEVEQPTVKLTSKKKVILGYKCKKAIVIDANGQEMDYWYTEEIKTVSTEKNSAINKLPGLALEYAMNRDNTLMTFKATVVEKSLDNATIKEKLSLKIPEGYEEVSYQEYTSAGGGN